MINFFKNENRYLSNFYMIKQTLNNITYNSNECYFQSMKSTDINIHKKFSILTSKEAKKQGKIITLRDDWKLIKNKIMYHGVYTKFKQNKNLMNKLKNTKNKQLIEGNFYHDNYWGDCYCDKCNNIKGKNILGKILMIVRNNFKKVN